MSSGFGDNVGSCVFCSLLTAAKHVDSGTCKHKTGCNFRDNEVCAPLVAKNCAISLPIPELLPVLSRSTPKCRRNLSKPSLLCILADKPHDVHAPGETHIRFQHVLKPTPSKRPIPLVAKAHRLTSSESCSLRISTDNSNMVSHASRQPCPASHSSLGASPSHCS